MLKPKRTLVIYNGAFTLQVGRRRKAAIERSRRSAGALRELLDAERIKSYGRWLPHIARYEVERHLVGTGAKVAIVAPDVLERLELLRSPNPLPAIIRSSWDGLSREQCDLVEQYKPYALARAKEFWIERVQRRELGVVTGYLHSADLDDLRQTALLELCTSARWFDPAAGVSFASFVSLAVKGAIEDWARERWSVVHRSNEAWKAWRKEWGKPTKWLDESLDAPLKPSGGESGTYHDPEDDKGDGSTLLALGVSPGSYGPGQQSGLPVPSDEWFGDWAVDSGMMQPEDIVKSMAHQLSAVEHDVALSRLLAGSDPTPQKVLADRYGISEGRISQIEARVRDKIVHKAHKRQELLPKNNFRKNAKVRGEPGDI
jgi:RNA polymerase sigma factor (sigma-70 family)